MRRILAVLAVAGMAGALSAQSTTAPAATSAAPVTTTPAVTPAPAASPLPATKPAPTAAPATAPPSAPPTPAVAPPRTTMANALAQQRASVLKQVTSVTGQAAAPADSFFTVPWIGNMAAARPAPPPCDAMAKLELDQLIEQNAKEHGVKSDLIRAVISQESGNRPCAVSAKGAQGLMQLMPATADELNVADPFNARQNVEGGTKLLKQLLAKYKGDVALTLAAYNAGSGRVDRDGGIPAIPETMSYVTSILSKLPKR